MQYIQNNCLYLHSYLQKSYIFSKINKTNSMNQYSSLCRLRSCVTCVGLLISIGATAQDVHFSNAARVPLYLNPAQTGFFKEQAVANISSRLQSFATTTDFSTTALSYQHRFDKTLSKSYWAIGGQLQYEKAAYLDLSHLNLDASIAYAFPLEKNKTVRIGGLFGIHQRTNANQKLLWGDQFKGTTVDPNLPTQDMLAQNQNFTFLDASAGIQYHEKVHSRQDWHIGLGIFHLNRAKQNFGNDSKINYPIRFSLHGGAKYRINRETDLKINTWLQIQDLTLFHNEIGQQVTFNYILNDVQSVEAGVLLRQNLKAGWMTIAPQLGFNYDNWRISAGYDVNLNSACLNCANGGFELHITKSIPLKLPEQPKEGKKKVPAESKPEEVIVSAPAPVEDLPTEKYESTPLIHQPNAPNPTPVTPVPTPEPSVVVTPAPTPSPLPAVIEPAVITPIPPVLVVSPVALPAFPIALYFDNDIPKVGVETSYASSYLKYVDLRDSLQQLYAKTNQLPTYDRTILDFFELEVIPNFQKIHLLYNALHQSMLLGETLEVTVSAGTSDIATFEYNRKLAQRRFDAFYNDLKQYQNGVLMPYLNNKQLIVNQLPFKTNLFPTAPETKKLNALIGIDALQRRKVEVLSIKKL